MYLHHTLPLIFIFEPDLASSSVILPGKESVGAPYPIVFSVMSTGKPACLLWDPEVGSTYGGSEVRE